MTKSWPLLALAVLGAIAATLCLAAFDWTAWACRLPAGDEGKVLTPGFGGCVEFWLNRYQTLISAFVAGIAAAAAWIAVQKQVKATERQIAIGLGDLDPDFYMYGGQIESDRGYSNVIIEIANNNRLDITLNQIQVIGPIGFEVQKLSYAVQNQHREIRFWKADNIYTFDLRMLGTRPAAPEPSRLSLTLRSATVAGPLVGEKFQFTLMKVRLVYLYRTQTMKGVTVDLHCGIAVRNYQPVLISRESIEPL